MNEAIVAQVVEVERPKRPRLYGIIREEGGAWMAVATESKNGVIDERVRALQGTAEFTIPGTDDVWTEERVMEAARMHAGRTKVEYLAGSPDDYVAFAKTLGVLGGGE